MRSKEKLEVRVTRRDYGEGPKLWAEVRARSRHHFDPWVPSFEDLARIIFALVHCENENYQGRVAEPARKVARFLTRCVQDGDRASRESGGVLSPEAYEDLWDRIAEDFQMPARTRRAPTVELVAAVGAGDDCGPGCTCDLCRDWPLAEVSHG